MHLKYKRVSGLFLFKLGYALYNVSVLLMLVGPGAGTVEPAVHGQERISYLESPKPHLKERGIKSERAMQTVSATELLSASKTPT